MQLKRHFRAGRQPREAVMTFLEGNPTGWGWGDQEALVFYFWKHLGVGDGRIKYNQSLTTLVPSEGQTTLGRALRDGLGLWFSNWNF